MQLRMWIWASKIWNSYHLLLSFLKWFSIRAKQSLDHLEVYIWWFRSPEVILSDFPPFIQPYYLIVFCLLKLIVWYTGISLSWYILFFVHFPLSIILVIWFFTGSIHKIAVGSAGKWKIAMVVLMILQWRRSLYVSSLRSIHLLAYILLWRTSLHLG